MAAAYMLWIFHGNFEFLSDLQGCHEFFDFDLKFFWCSDGHDCNFGRKLRTTSVRTSNFRSIGSVVQSKVCDRAMTHNAQFSPYTLPRASYPQSHPPSPLLHPHNSPVTPMTARGGAGDFEWICDGVRGRTENACK